MLELVKVVCFLFLLCFFPPSPLCVLRFFEERAFKKPPNQKFFFSIFLFLFHSPLTACLLTGSKANNRHYLAEEARNKTQHHIHTGPLVTVRCCCMESSISRALVARFQNWAPAAQCSNVGQSETAANHVCRSALEEWRGVGSAQTISETTGMKTRAFSMREYTKFALGALSPPARSLCCILIIGKEGQEAEGKGRELVAKMHLIQCRLSAKLGSAPHCAKLCPGAS